MTTIAYSHKDKEIAFDSRTTSGGMIVNDKERSLLMIKRLNQ